MPFYLLLSSVAWEANLMEYWQEGSPSTAIPLRHASDVRSHHNKIGHVTFGVAFVLNYCDSQVRKPKVRLMV